jgi:hypothetical protein
MSSRQLRKLRQQQELLALQKENTDQDSDSGTDDNAGSLPVSRPSKPKFAGFAALAGEDDQDDDEEIDDAEHIEASEAPGTSPQVEDATPVKKSKKSKKKKKKAGNQNAPLEDKEFPVADKDLDEIDRAIRELNLPKEGTSVNTTTTANLTASPAERVNQLLRVNFQHLKVLNEMRRLFGKEAMETAEHEDDTQNARGRRQRQPRQQQVDIETFLRGQPGNGISDVVLRRNPFIEGKRTWPRAATGGLSMTTIGDPKADVVEFSFTHDKAYGQIEAQFFFLVGMHDPMKLVYFLQQYPYHVSTLIQVSRVAHQDQNAAFAAELCERALFTFGRVTLSSFRKKLEEGKARLSFMRPENRQFWLAGYHYIKNLIRKGTYRTALEWAKLFFSINREDPYGMLNWIQVLAIRSREAQWFIDLCDTVFKTSPGPELGNTTYIQQTKVLAHLQLGDRDGAKTTLAEGMRQVPWLYTKLFGAIDVDVPPNLWGIPPPNDEEQLRTDLYIHVAAELWNNTEAIGLLQQVGATPAKYEETAGSTHPISLSTARFVYLDGKPDLMSGVPREMLHATPNFDFDPLPPPQEENVFSDDKQKLPWTTSPGENRSPPDIRALLGGAMPAAIPANELQEMEALTEDQDVPEETRGLLRRFLDMLGGAGGLGAETAEVGGHRMPGGFMASDDEFAEDLDGWEEEVDDDGLVDDFGDQHDHDDEDI